MKNFMKTGAVVLMLAAVTLAGCKKDEDNSDDKDSVTAMTITTAKAGKAAMMIAGYGTAVIDWGDGTAPDTATFPKTILVNCNHTFSDATPHTITISGRNVIGLYCPGMGLTAIDVTGNTALTGLDCGGNQLTRLDVSKNIGLKFLECYTNQLTALDVSNNPALISLECQTNRLTSLDMSRNTSLRDLACHFNLLNVERLNALFDSLNDNTVDKEIDISQNPGAYTCSQSIATNKGWTVIAD